jgi:hypothetical protein
MNLRKIAATVILTAIILVAFNPFALAFVIGVN